MVKRTTVMSNNKLTAPPQEHSPEMLWWAKIIEKIIQGKQLELDEAKESTYKLFKSLEEEKPETTLILSNYFGSLTMKGLTIEELVGMSLAMEQTKPFNFKFETPKPVVTGGGTGGDTLKTINVTTPAVLIASAAGAFAVKSAVKAFSSKTGAADLALTMGINVYTPPKIVKECVEKLGTTVWSSTEIYPWMAPLLKLQDAPTAPIIFPLLASLRIMIATALNPFSLKRQLRGTAIPQTKLIAEVFSKIGYEKALVPIGYGKNEDIRLDEFSSLGKTVVSELKPDGKVETYEVYPEDFGVKLGNADEIRAGDTHEENTRAVLKVLAGRDKSSRRDLILINAGAILYLADLVKNLRDGYELACNVVDSGGVIEKVRQLVIMSGGDLNQFNLMASST